MQSQGPVMFENKKTHMLIVVWYGTQKSITQLPKASPLEGVYRRYSVRIGTRATRILIGYRQRGKE